MARAGAWLAGLAFVGVAAAAVFVAPELIDRYGDRVSTQRCTVTVDGATHELTAEQSGNAALIAAVGWSYGFGDDGVAVAIATAIQESSLRNIDYGDRDSVGLFQQRPSQGWGTVEQILDPYYSAAKFYEALALVDGWQDMELTVAAQTVQRSAFPDAYGDHEPEARLWASALGGTAGVISCDIADPAASTSQALLERVAQDLGAAYTVEVLGYEGDTTIMGIRHVEDTPAFRARAAAWAVATASSTSALWVDNTGSRWSVDGTVTTSELDEQWQGYPGIRVALYTG